MREYRYILDIFDPHGYLAERHRLSNHSAMAEIKTTFRRNIVQRELSEEGISQPRFKLSRIPNYFMYNYLNRLAIVNIIMQIELFQDQIYTVYSNLCEVIISEMRAKIPMYDSTDATR